MSITANRYPGIRAALCTDAFMARLSREHNDANVLCLGARVVGVGLALDIVNAWINASFAGGRHQRRVEKIEREADWQPA
jgi:ribose 5-phosphate isomerase B